MRTDEKLDQLCERLQSNCGDIHEAARWLGMSPAFVHSWINDDEEAAKRINEAKLVGYGAIESELIRRAVRGIEEDVYYKGEVVGEKIVYSDGLLGKLVEAKLPEYKKGEGAGTAFYGPTQINVMPRAANYDEWLAMKATTLEQREEMPAIEGPKVPEVLQGDFVEVEEERPLKALADLL